MGTLTGDQATYIIPTKPLDDEKVSNNTATMTKDETGKKV